MKIKAFLLVCLTVMSGLFFPVSSSLSAGHWNYNNPPASAQTVKALEARIVELENKLQQEITTISKHGDLSNQESRIQVLETKNDLNEQFIKLRGTLNTHFQELSNETKQLQDDISYKKIEFYGFVFLLSLTVIVLYGGTYAWAKNLVQTTASDRVMKNKRYLGQAIRREELENRLKEKSKIVLLGKEESDINEFEGLIRSLRFINIDSFPISEFNPSQTPCDLVVFNEKLVKEYSDDVEKMIRDSGDESYFVCFVRGRFSGKDNLDNKSQDKINLANSPTTLLGAIMNVLKYRETIKNN